MKKIGIITIDKCNNYGAELQAYASVKILNEMGYDAEIIDYLYYKNPGYQSSKASRPLFNLTIIQKIEYIVKYKFGTKLLYVVLPFFISKIKRRNNRFHSFHLRNTKMSPTYKSLGELYSNVGDYDVYISGSDQIWNPYTETNLAPYFLQFAPQKAKKISFASSFGVTEIPPFAKAKYREWLNQFDALSCRELAGVNIIKELLGKDAVHVLDPTLLLNKDQWMQIKGAEIDVPERFVLIYETRPSLYIQRIAIDYSKNNKIPIYRLCLQAIGNKEDDTIINIEDAGPADFINLFSKASLIVTNSFHGTAFACNFGKNFYTVISHFGKKNSRMISLLEKLELKNRIIWEEDSYPLDLGIMYNTERSQSILVSERLNTNSFLKNAIEN